MISLSLASGIPPQVWWEQDYRTLATATELLTAEHQRDRPGHDEQGRQMSG